MVEDRSAGSIIVDVVVTASADIVCIVSEEGIGLDGIVSTKYLNRNGTCIVTNLPFKFYK